MLETIFSLPTQEFQTLLEKCDPIPLLGGIKIVWDPPEMKVLQSQIIVQNSQAHSLSNPEVSNKNLTG
jgi:hypothetical protein